MPSVIAEYEYDIFISYRHNDNRSGWVTEFVNALQEELAATIKESISIYFDSNPHDGLLETHNVDKSLERKLKCLIFIPILSQTYCDPKSFAWQHEFCTFNKLAQEDQFGRDIQLNNGNVASRILPVKIHDLDADDRETIQNEIGGVLRAIEFIFNSPGVNRSLRSNEDHPNDNLNKTYYRDQVNKVANAVKELVTALKHPTRKNEDALGDNNFQVPDERNKKPVKKILLAALGIMMLFALIYGVSQYTRSSNIGAIQKDKSIAVLPFVNLSNDPDQDYFSDGMMEEILNHLVKIGELKVISRTTMMQYKGTTKSMGVIADELSVATLLEGSVRKAGDQLRITVQLIDGNTDLHLWSETYDRKMDDVFSIQSDVAQQVAAALQAEISPELKARIEHKPTENLEAYNLWLMGNSDDFSKLSYELWTKATQIDSTFAPAYSSLSAYWLNNGAFAGNVDREQILSEALSYINKALALDKNYPEAHLTLSYIYLWYQWDFEASERELIIYQKLSPASLNGNVANLYSAAGRFEEAIAISKLILASDVTDPFKWGTTGLPYYFDGQIKKGDDHYEEALRFFPDHWYVLSEAGRAFIYSDRYQKTIDVLNHMLEVNANARFPRTLGCLAIAYFKTSEAEKAQNMLDELIQKSKISSSGSPSFYISMTYAQMGKIELAYQWLEKAYQDREVEMYWLKVEPPFAPLHNDPRWQEMLDKVGFPTG